MHLAVPATLLAVALVGVLTARVGKVQRVRALLAAMFFHADLVADPAVAPGHRAPFGRAFVGLTTGLKLIAMTVWTVLFLATTRNEALTAGLLRLGLLYPVAFAFTTALRLVPSLAGAAVTTIAAQKSRAALTPTRLLDRPGCASTCRRRTNHRQHRSAQHKRSPWHQKRGVFARPGRTSLLELRLTTADWVTLLMSAALVLPSWLWGSGS